MLPKGEMSLRSRIALFTAGCSLVTVLVLGAAIFFSLKIALLSSIDDQLKAIARGQVVRAAHTPGNAVIWPRQFRNFSESQSNVDVFELALSAPSGSVLLATANAPSLPVAALIAASRERTGGAPRVERVGSGPHPYQIAFMSLTRPLAVHTTYGVAMANGIVVGQSLDQTDHTLTTLTVLVGLAALGALILAGPAGWLVARRAVTPLSELAGAAERIGNSSATDDRLPVMRGSDEICRLVHAFNGSLERLSTARQALETLLVQQRQLVADVSHDLRTPITSIRADLETIALYPDQGEAERQACLHEAMAELDRMTRMLENMLALARADTLDAVNCTTFSWDEFFTDLAADANWICRPRVLTITDPPHLGVGTGDPDMLRRALRAVLDNAARHTSPDSTVSLTAARNGESIVIEVADDGPGVPPEHLEHVFDRFFRLDPARSAEGSGLGLAIARQVAESSGGSVHATLRSPRGLAVRFTFPCSIGPVREAGAGPVWQSGHADLPQPDRTTPSKPAPPHP